MLVIKDDKLNSLIEELKKEYDFIDVRGEILPVKKYFFPPVEETFYLENGKISVSGSLKKEFVLFGLTDYSLEALDYLDKIMKNPNEDFFYNQRRKLATVIGLLGGETEAVYYGDIVLEKDEGMYEVFVNTDKGRSFIVKYKKFFEELPEEDVEKTVAGKKSEGWSETMRELLTNPELLKDAVEWSYAGYPTIWERLQNECIGCGICTYVCPLCHCFSIEDKIDLNDRCSRCRQWDACTLPDFAKISGGHDFRPTIKERYYNWFYHKFVRAFLEYGKSQCVGCAACKRYCPARIDIQEVLREILREYIKTSGIK